MTSSQTIGEKPMPEQKLHELESICSNLVSQLLDVQEIIPDETITEISETIQFLFDKTDNSGFLLHAVAEELQ